MPSTIISVRQNPNDPDEARALTIWRAWQAVGWKPRQIITRALLALEGQEPPSPGEIAERLAAIEANQREILALLRQGIRLDVDDDEIAPSVPEHEQRQARLSAKLRSLDFDKLTR